MKTEDIQDIQVSTYYPNRSDEQGNPYAYRLRSKNVYMYRYPEKANPFRSSDLVDMLTFKMWPIRSYYALVRKFTNFTYQGSIWNPPRWDPGYYSYTYGEIRPVPIVPDWVEMVLSQREIQANVEFLNKLNDRRVSLIEELRNRKDTVDAFIGAAGRMATLYKRCLRDPIRFVKSSRRKARRQGHKVTARAVKSYGDAWLEGRYHWIPTYLTLQKAFVGLQDTGVVGRVFYKTDFPPVSFMQTLADSWHFQKPWEVQFNIEVTHELSCWIHINSEAIALARRYGIGGFTDLAAVAWELTPWSLVVDWVVPVTDILLALNATAGVDVFLGCRAVTRKITMDDSSEPPLLDPSTGYTWKTLSKHSFDEYEEYKRIPIQPSDLPVQPYIATPSDLQKVLRVVDALSFFSGSKMGQKIISGKI